MFWEAIWSMLQMGALDSVTLCHQLYNLNNQQSPIYWPKGMHRHESTSRSLRYFSIYHFILIKSMPKLLWSQSKLAWKSFLRIFIPSRCVLPDKQWKHYWNFIESVAAKKGCHIHYSDIIYCPDLMRTHEHKMTAGLKCSVQKEFIKVSMHEINAFHETNIVTLCQNVFQHIRICLHSNKWTAIVQFMTMNMYTQ